jgi:ABC-type transport system involved in cytochrome bd biosynthesis fused ATPase/permease subunit
MVRPYREALKIGAVIQCYVLAFSFFDFYAALVLTIANLIFTLLIIPVLVLMFSKRPWTKLPPKLGPQQ